MTTEKANELKAAAREQHGEMKEYVRGYCDAIDSIVTGKMTVTDILSRTKFASPAWMNEVEVYDDYLVGARAAANDMKED